MSLTRILSAIALGLIAQTGSVHAKPVSVPFDPPQVEAGSDTCSPRPPQHVLTERWKDYEGGPLGDRDVRLIRRDLRLLRQNDAKRWFDVIEAADQRLLKSGDGYDKTNLLLDRIDLLVAAGRMQDLADEGLVKRLLDMAPAGSASVKRTAAELLYNGTGVARDRKRAIALWRQAAYAGDSSSLLRMVELSYKQKIDDWNIAPNVAVTMALGNLLGDLDPLLCDRVNRIAAIFRDGEVVAPDPKLAEDWYRFAARLGGANAAWNLAEMNREATEVDRDNDLMMKSLRQAADFDLPYAMLRLGGILERGALTERDPEEARALYEEAAGYGDPTARIRLVNIARAHKNEPGGRARLADALDRMIDAPGTPAWAYAQRGNLVLEQQGRWAGEDRAAKLYAEALKIDPTLSAARMHLAEIKIRDADGEQDLLNIVSELRDAVYIDGKTEPMQDLQAIFQCRSRDAPILSESKYWTKMEEFAGDSTVELTPSQLDAVNPQDDPLTVARLQSQAINMRARSLANFYDVNPEGAGDKMRRMTEASGGALYTAEAKLALNRGHVGAAEDFLAQAIDAGETGAKTLYLSVLGSRTELDKTQRERMISLARDLAKNGNGTAIGVLIDHGIMDSDTAWRTYRDAIARNGDVKAMLFALPYLKKAGDVATYRARIRSTIDCTTSMALDYAHVLRKIDAKDGAHHWLKIASAVSEGDGWEDVAVADALREMGSSEDDKARAMKLYRAAADRGYPLALRRLLSLRQDGKIEMSTEKTAAMTVRLLKIAAPKDIADIFNFLEYSDPKVREIVNAKVDRRALYAEAAKKGNAAAQLELARIVRESDAPEDTAERYASLLQSAADGGNADAMYLLSQAYAYGVGVDQSMERSRKLLLAAARAGNETAAATARLIQ
ncbi:tetratricopeptide repeat protein [Thioclava nitratireducens]|uniref:tetratricopeptide repeat protein n=1 Tax=Thioclava nitratireducens TaxID=1915078 RepID=UPI0024801F42|nr:hypothetical protein [Thioclava nitratireducens]WGT49802.1 hypothetical protein P0N61_16055 [Thioclava nitratireducens]